MRSEPPTYFLDVCVPIYAAGRPHPYREPCLRLLAAAADEALDTVTSVEVLQELLYRYDSLGRRADGLRVAESFQLTVRAVLPVTHADSLRAMQFLRTHRSLGPADALHIAVMHNAGLHHIITADRHFDGVPGIHRTDPADLTW